jgi:bacteriophage exclusion system BrxC/D-like protein
MSDVISIIEQIAQHGHAPRDGCSRFGVGYDDAFRRLRRSYLERGFARGSSAEKFVVGPFGSGKTHFVRHFAELARDLDCVTAEVALNKDVDFTQSLVVYREVARKVRVPGRSQTGLRNLLQAAVERIKSSAPEPVGEQLCQAWASGLETAHFEHESYRRGICRALAALLQDNDSKFDDYCRWLEGEVSDRALAKRLEMRAIPKAEEGLFGRLAMLSLFQLVRHARFSGTVVAFDEAEQGLNVDKRKTERILSLLQSSINAMADLQGGSALVLFAVTPDIVAKMENFAALQQRVADPEESQGFFDGNTMAAKIDLSRRGDAVEELRSIGRRLVHLLYGSEAGPSLSVSEADVLARVDAIAEDVVSREESVGSRRSMAKRTCALLMHVYDEGALHEGNAPTPPPPETEV